MQTEAVSGPSAEADTRAFRMEVSWRRWSMILMGVVFFALYFAGYPRNWTGDQTFVVPRERVGYLLSERFAQGHGFSQPLLHYDRLPRDIALALTPSDAASLNGEVLPQDFAGTMLLFGFLMKLWQPLALFVTPAFAVATAVALAAVAVKLLGEDAGPPVMLGWLTYAPFYLNSTNILTSDLPALFFMILGVWFFLRLEQEPRLSVLAGLCLSLSLSVLFRYSNVLMAAPLLLFAFRDAFRRPKQLVAAAAALPACAALLLFNAAVYGSPLTTGFHLRSRLVAETANFANRGLVQFDSLTFVSYLYHYLVSNPIILGPPFAGLVWGIAHWRRSRNAPLLVVLLSSGLLAAYYLQIDGWGRTGFNLNASVLRYLLPALAIWMVLLVGGLKRLTDPYHLVFAGFIAALALAGFSTAHSAPSGVNSNRDVVGYLEAARARLIQGIEPDAIVATQLYSKVLFPYRQTLTLQYLLQSEKPLYLQKVWSGGILPTPERFASVASAIDDRNIPFYLMVRIPPDIESRYAQVLAQRGLLMEKRFETEPGLYRVSRAPA